MYSTCTSNIFKKDLKDLCEQCPLVIKINNGIKDQILAQANEQKEVLTNEQFENYINKEIENATSSMQRVLLIEEQNTNNKNDEYRKKRIELYIWNKERIKALNSFVVKKQVDENPHPRIFTSKRGFNIFNSYSQDINHNTQLADYSFIYWMLKSDNFIHDGVSPKEYTEWLDKNYEVYIDKLKQLHLCSSKTRAPLYSTLKDLHKD